MSRQRGKRFDWFTLITILLMVFFVVFALAFASKLYLDYTEAFGGTAYPKGVTKETTKEVNNKKAEKSEPHNQGTDARAEWGQLGDFFGGTLNPVFGFVSIMALFLTILYQSRELKLSTEELHKSAEALNAQNAAIEHQRFEQTFFAWMSTYREILSEIHTDGTPSKTGRNALYEWWHIGTTKHIVDKLIYKVFPEPDFVSWYQSGLNLPIPNKLRESLLGKALDSWEGLYTDPEHEYQLDSLFRVLFNLLRWIDSQSDAQLNVAQKWLYVSIVRAQLSWIEMIYFYFNGLTPRGNKFKLIAEKYALFDNLNFDANHTVRLLKNYSKDEGGYAETAYDSASARTALLLPETAEATHVMAAEGLKNLH